jgi:hypothetical protein
MKKEMFEALLAVQTEIKPVKKDAENPFFKSGYATLAAIWEQIQPTLAKHGFVIIQPVQNAVVETHLIHASGEEVISLYPLIVKNATDPQAHGAACTYARRYALSALLGIVTEDDDDGNATKQQEPIETKDTGNIPEKINAIINNTYSKKWADGKPHTAYKVNVDGVDIFIDVNGEQTAVTGDDVEFLGITSKIGKDGKTYYNAKSVVKVVA